MYPLTLAGRLVTLREFRAGDLPEVLAIIGDDAVTRWLSFDSRSEDVARTMLDGIIERATQEPRTEYYLATTVRDELVGFVRLALAGVQAAKLGYALRADRWGHGYGTDAARTLINFGFRELGIHRISAAIGPDNAASIAVVQRLGMRREGVLRDHVFTNGEWRDSVLYSVLADEWATADSRRMAA